MYLHPTFFRWIITAVLTVAFTGFHAHPHPSSSTASRRLKIQPKDCTSNRHENIVGTCMFSLECQERQGRVIGACYDRFLVGACCIVPEVLIPPETSTKSSNSNNKYSVSSSSSSKISNINLHFQNERPGSPPTISSTNGGFGQELLLRSTTRPKPDSQQPQQGHGGIHIPVPPREEVRNPGITSISRINGGKFTNGDALGGGGGGGGQSSGSVDSPLHSARFPVRPTIGSILSAIQSSINDGIAEKNAGGQEMVSLHALNTRLSAGKLTTLPASPQHFALLSLPLETLPNSSHPSPNGLPGDNSNLHHKNGQSIISLESTPLNTPTNLYKISSSVKEIQDFVSASLQKSEPLLQSNSNPIPVNPVPAPSTEEPPKLTTWYEFTSAEVQNNLNKYRYNLTQLSDQPSSTPAPTPSNREDVDETTTMIPTSVFTESLSSNSNSSNEKVWNVILQLASQVSDTTENDSLLGSDETYVTLVGNEETTTPSRDASPSLVNSVRDDILQKNSQPFSNTPPSSMSEETTILSEYLKDYIDTTTLKAPTNKPWASSTYQVHTFKYPEHSPSTQPPLPVTPNSNPAPSTTVNSVGGLTTWFDMIPHSTPSSVNNILSSLPTPSTTTQEATTQFKIPITTTATTTTTTTTTSETPTTVSTTKLPLRFRPRPTTEKIWLTRPTTTERVYTLPPRKKPTPGSISSLGMPNKKATVAPLTSLIMASKIGATSKKPIFDTHSDEDTMETSMQHEDLEANLDDFVNQVVQGLAGTLDNLDLDDMILSASAKPQDASNDGPSTLHPLSVLSDPLFPPFPVTNQVKLTKPSKGTTSTTTKLPPKKVITSTTTTTEKITTTSRKPMNYRSDCGVRPLIKQGRIVGGKPAKLGKWPWQALVREATWLGLFSKNKCGGVLISKKYVLTAAHCQPGFLATLTVVLGDFDISSESDTTSSPVTKNVKRVIVHRDYNAQTFENDIALLELESPIEFKEHIIPICLPNEEDISVGQHAFVTGWGRLKYGGGVPQELHEVDVPIINNTECQNMFLRSGHVKAIRESFICAGYEKGLKDSCEGDSGGPLALQRNNGQWVLAGTVSHGIKCAYPNLPGVYMRMTFYKPWIKRVTGIV